MRAPSALLVLALLAAGCTVEPPEVQRGPEPAAPGANPAGIPGAGNATALVVPEAPAWQVRQWWRMRGAGGGFDRTETRVVTADQGASYLVDTSDPEVAYFDARFDISTIGPIRKADLAGYQQGQPVEFYRFPLATNNTWTTSWDGQPRTVTVLGPQPASVGGRTLPALLLEGRQGDQLRVRYNYVPELQHFSFMEFLDPDGTFRLDVLGSGQQYNGTVAQARVATLYEDVAAGNLQPAGAFTVAAGVTFLEAELTFMGDRVQYSVTLTTPDNQVQGPFSFGPCAANCTFQETRRLPALPGEWKVATSGLVQGGQTEAHAMLVVRAATIAERTVA